MTVATISYSTFDSPVGTFVLAARHGCLVSVRIITPVGRFAPAPSWQRKDDELTALREQFAGYFAGEVTQFDLPLALQGTPFQLRAWDALRKVPFGSTTTYGALAKAIGSPDASRAVGLAMNRNPITLALPCHRVVGRDGSLRGYLSGLETKHDLIAFEAAHGMANSPLSWERFVRGRDSATSPQTTGHAVHDHRR